MAISYAKEFFPWDWIWYFCFLSFFFVLRCMCNFFSKCMLPRIGLGAAGTFRIKVFLFCFFFIVQRCSQLTDYTLCSGFFFFFLKHTHPHTYLVLNKTITFIFVWYIMIIMRVLLFNSAPHILIVYLELNIREGYEVFFLF